MVEEKVAEVKSILRGLLISSPRQMTIEGLRRDFRLQEGKDIPYRDFGFTTLPAFLKSIPDTLSIKGEIVHPILCDKSAHVDALVTKQKVTKPPSRHSVSFSRRRKGLLPSYFADKPVPLSEASTLNRTLLKTPVNGFPPSRGSFVPSSVQSTLYTLLSRHPEGVRFQDIQADVCSKYPLDKYDIHSAQELVELLPHLAKISNGLVYPAVEIRQRSSGTNSVSGERRSTQDSNNSNHNMKGTRSVNTSSRVTPRSDGPSQSQARLTTNRVTFIPAGSESRVESPQTSTNGRSHNFQKSEDQNHKSISPIGSTNGSLSPCGTPVSDKGTSSNSSQERQNNPCINDKIISNFRLILDECPNGVWCTELPDKYREKFGASLNFRSYGFTSMVQMAAELPEVFHVLRPYGNDFMLLDARKPIPTRFTNHDLFNPEYDKHHNYPDNVTVPHFIQKNIMRLLREYPGGLREDLFLSKYEDKYLTSLCILKMGFSSLDSFIQYLMEVNILRIGIAQDSVDGEVTVLLPIEVENLFDDHNDEEPLSVSFPKTIRAPDLSLYPPDVLGPYDDIPQETIPSYVGERKYVEVFVGEVRDPTTFWVQLCGADHRDGLDSLMDDIQAFYVLHMHEYKMPKAAVRANQICACSYSSDWHRARILSIPNLEEVEVFYIDYGTKSRVKVTDLCFLIKKFSYLPAQAIRCSLTNLKPPKGATKWPSSASRRFLQMVSDKPLVGLVASIDQQTQSFTAALVDTSSDVDFHINDNLVLEGHAEFITTSDSLVEEKPTVDEEPEDIHSKPHTDEPACVLPSASVSSSLRSSAQVFVPSTQQQSSTFAMLGSRNGPNLELPAQKISPANLRLRTGLSLELPADKGHSSKEHTNIKTNNDPDSELLECKRNLSSSHSSLSSLSNTEVAENPAGQKLPPGLLTQETNPEVQPEVVNYQPTIRRPPPGFPAKNLPWGLNSNITSQQSTPLAYGSDVSKPNTFMNPNPFPQNQIFNTPNTSFASPLNSYGVPLPHASFASGDFIAFQSPFYFPNQMHQQQYFQPLQAPQFFAYNQPGMANLCNQSALVNSMLNSSLVHSSHVNGPPPAHLPNPTFKAGVGFVPPKPAQNTRQKDFSCSFDRNLKQSVPSPLSIDPSVILCGNVSSSASTNSSEVNNLERSEDFTSKTVEQLHLDKTSESQQVTIDKKSPDCHSVEEDEIVTELEKSCTDPDSTEQNTTKTTCEPEVQEESITNIACGSEQSREEDFVSATSEPPGSVSSLVNPIEDYEDVVYRSDSEKDEDSRNDSEQEEDDVDADVVVEEVREELSPIEPHHIKETIIAGKKVLLLNVRDEPFLCTDQFVPLFTPFTTRFAVTKILESYSIKIPFYEADRKDHPELFDTLEAIPTEYLKKTTDGRICRRIHLLPLKSTMDVLKALNQSSDIQDAFQVEISNFNPQDIYWTGNTSGGT
ncbi:uncharacterized protein [Anabrus simplex]|uniref:uncharacterized protein isoform X2 n=1 Tax=Anabrus simplex TaxID=316456 RepID=UPI0035A34E64